MSGRPPARAAQLSGGARREGRARGAGGRLLREARPGPASARPAAAHSAGGRSGGAARGPGIPPNPRQDQPGSPALPEARRCCPMPCRGRSGGSYGLLGAPSLPRRGPLARTCLCLLGRAGPSNPLTGFGRHPQTLPWRRNGPQCSLLVHLPLPSPPHHPPVLAAPPDIALSPGVFLTRHSCHRTLSPSFSRMLGRLFLFIFPSLAA